MAKARTKSAPPVSRFDGEALGLVLFALGIFLGVTLLLFQGGADADVGDAGFMSRARGVLLGELGWAAYLLPVVPIAYGTLVFLGRGVRNLTRRLLGGVLVVASLLALHEVFQPGQAGALAERVMRPPFRALSYAAALLPLVTLTLGLEVMLRLAPLTMLKAFFRQISMLLGGASAGVQGAIEARQEGREAARARGHARQGLAAHGRELDALRRLYPNAPELAAQHEELRAAQRDLRAQDEAGLRTLERDLAQWQGTLRTFVNNAARDLRELVAREAPGAGADAEALENEVRHGRHELSVELASTQASGALERLRRAMVSEIQRLSGRAGKLERERKAAEKALARADVSVLAREWPAHRERVDAWQTLAQEFTAWRGRAVSYPGWPDLTAAFDRAPTEVAAELAEALNNAPDDTLREQDQWREQLAQAQEQVQEQARRHAEAITGPPMPEASPPALDFDFSGAPVIANTAVPGTSVPASAPTGLSGDPASAEHSWGAPPAAPAAQVAPAAQSGDVDPFADWDDDDLPFGPQSAPVARSHSTLATVATGAPKPGAASARSGGAGAPWESAEAPAAAEPRRGSAPAAPPWAPSRWRCPTTRCSIRFRRRP